MLFNLLQPAGYFFLLSFLSFCLTCFDQVFSLSSLHRRCLLFVLITFAFLGTLYGKESHKYKVAHFIYSVNIWTVMVRIFQSFSFLPFLLLVK